ncbi:hypothetical protein [Kitasatospora sp. NPDC004289]
MTHSDPGANYGVQQSGGHSQVGNQAVGPGALAQSSPAPAAPSVQQPRSQR